MRRLVVGGDGDPLEDGDRRRCRDRDRERVRDRFSSLSLRERLGSEVVGATSGAGTSVGDASSKVGDGLPTGNSIGSRVPQRGDVGDRGD